MDDVQRREALFEAVRELAPATDLPATPVPPPARLGRAVVALAMGWAFLGYIWIARPDWVFGPQPDAAASAERRDASLRFALYLERGRIEEFAQDHGTLPTTLAEAGPVEEGVSWQPQGEDYLLTGTWQGATLQLARGMSADSFLGNALSVLRQ